MLFFLPEWLAAWARYTTRRDAPAGDEDGPTEQGDSPWLEEQRKWQARIYRQKYLREKGTLVEVGSVTRVFELVAGALRGGADQYCEPCRALHEAALGDAQRLVEQDFPDGGDDNTDEELGELDEEHLAEPQPGPRAGPAARGVGPPEAPPESA